MKRIYWIVIFIFTTMFATAQDSWKINLNGKLLLSGTTENVAANTKTIKATELTKKGSLDILYKEETPKKDWIRSLIFYDEGDNVLMRKDSVGATTKISNASLKEILGDKKKVRIYTISLPTDPDLAATIRVRRVHLCTLELQ